MEIHKAESLLEVENMKSEGKDPIMFRESSDEIHVFSRTEDIERRLWGMRWETNNPDSNGYQKFTFIFFTKAHEEELLTGRRPAQIQDKERPKAKKRAKAS